MPEPRPTNERLAELLEELVREVRAVKEEQQRLAAEVARLAAG